MSDDGLQIESGSVNPRTFHWLVVSIVALAFGVRLAYLVQIEDIPFFYDLIGDGKAYWAWAGRIADGDWLGSEVFYQAPAYPYFLALLRLVVGTDLWWAHVAHAALGSLACGLLALAGGSFVSRRAGLYTGLIVALYGPAIFFDGLIQKATLSLFLTSLLLCLLGQTLRAGDRAGRRIALALAAGVVSGLLALTREQALLLGAVVLLWLLRRGTCRMPCEGTRLAPSASGDAGVSCAPAHGQPNTPGRRVAAASAALFLVGVGLVLGPVAWRNYRVGGEVTLTTVQAGPNFYIGNHEGATGRYITLVPGAEWPPLERQAATELAQTESGRTLAPGEVSRYWLGRSWDYIKRQPVDWLRLLAYKWGLVWNAYELSDTESFTLYAHLSWLLGSLAMLNHFGVLCPLAVIGLVATVRRRRGLWLLYGMILMVAGGVALFFVFARYRYPLVPLLAIFAGGGVVEIGRTLRSALARETRGHVPVSARRVLPSCLTVIVAAAVAVACNLRFEHQRELDATAYENWGTVAGDQGNYALSAYLLNEALRYRPDSYALHTHLGAALVAGGDTIEAVAHFAQALDLKADHAPAHYHAGKTMAHVGRTELALFYLGEAVRINPDFARAHFRLGLLHAANGRLDEAVHSYREVLRINPHSAAAHFNLGAVLEHQGRANEAITEYNRALEIDPDYAKARDALSRQEPQP